MNSVIAIQLLVLSLSVFSCTSNIETVRDDREARLVRFGTEINSSGDDLAPVVSADGQQLLFTSNRRTTNDESEDFDIYASQRNGETWSKAEKKKLRERDELDEGAITIDYRRAHVYFQQCYMPDGIGDCDIYEAEIVNGSWANVRDLGSSVNSKDWDAHPSITRDGNTLYFSSERYGGIGGADIWIAQRQPDGTWNAPMNAGETINTKGDEKCPSISADGKVLFFSSNYHDGFGGYDIFRSNLTENKWSRPLNMGKPYNSDEDDLFFASSATEDTAFVSSNRKGSLGGLDVYEIIRLAPPPKPVEPVELKPLVLQVTVLNEFTLKPVQASLIISTEGKKDLEIETDDNGNAGHEIEGGISYSITALCSGFLTSNDLFIAEKYASGVLKKQILLKPIRENERVIYAFRVEFDFDRFNIRPEERRHLDSASVLLARYPKSTVVVAGHTDSVGTVQYNMILSYNRASRVGEYVKSFLESKGVTLFHPLQIRSYGKSQPVDVNETVEGRQKNRRVEISIVRDE